MKYQDTRSRPEARTEARMDENTQVRTFRNMEVYQDSLELSSWVMTKVIPPLEKKEFPELRKLVELALSIPLRISECYAVRFRSHHEGMNQLFETTLLCNRMITYLDLIRVIYADTDKSRELCEELIQKYFFVRVKLYQLQKSWQPSRREGGSYDQNNRSYRSNSSGYRSSGGEAQDGRNEEGSAQGRGRSYSSSYGARRGNQTSGYAPREERRQAAPQARSSYRRAA